MEEKEAIDVLIQVARIAQQKGILSLEDANVVLQVINFLTPKSEDNGEAKE